MEEPTKEKIRIFVYGTLKQGFGNNALLSKSEYLGADTITGFKMISKGAFPAVIRTTDRYYRVYGEVYQVDEVTLLTLDYLEGVPSHYQRISAETLSGRKVEVYIQEEPKEKYKMVSGGQWLGMDKTPTYDTYPTGWSYRPPTTPQSGAEIVVYRAPAERVAVGIDPVYAGLFDKPEANYVEPAEEKTAVKS